MRHQAIEFQAVRQQGVMRGENVEGCFVAKTNPFIDFLLEQFEPLGEIRVKAMFGGHGVYCNEVFFALVASGAVFLKADGVTRQEFEKKGLQAFRPFEDKPDVMQYYQAPPEMFEDPEVLKHWAGGAIAAGVRARTKVGTKKKTTAGVPSRPR